MGCAETRAKTSEERAIIFAEKGLQLHLQTASYIDWVLRKYSLNGKLNQAQLVRIAELLSMPIQNYEIHLKISALFDRLKNAEREYNLKDFLVVGILLGNDTEIVKAKLLFQVFDERLDGRLDINYIKSDVLPLIIKHATYSLPMLVSNDQTNFSNEVKILAYIENMKKGESKSIEVLTREMSNSKAIITEEMFIRFFKNFKDGDLIWPTGIRDFVNEISNTVVVTKALANPFKRQSSKTVAKNLD